MENFEDTIAFFLTMGEEVSRKKTLEDGLYPYLQNNELLIEYQSFLSIMSVSELWYGEFDYLANASITESDEEKRYFYFLLACIAARQLVGKDCKLAVQHAS